MAFDISGLSAWVPNIDNTLFKEAVAGSTTAKDLIDAGSVVFGKGDVAILKLDLDANFQSGDDSCVRNASGDVTLTNGTMTIYRIKDEKNLCFSKLQNTYYQLMTKGSIQPSEETATPEFANELIKLRVAKLAEANEKAIWIGYSAATASSVHNGITYGTDYANYNKFHGIIQQVAAGSPIGMTLSGSGIVAKLQNAYLSMPVATRSQADFRIALGQDLFETYKAALASTAATIGVPSENTIFGTSAKFWVVPGLNGTNKVYAIRLSNLRLGMNDFNDLDRVQLEYIKDATFHGWTSDVYFSIGIKVIDPTEVGYLAYS